MKKPWQKLSLKNIIFLRNYYIILFCIGFIITAVLLSHSYNIKNYTIESLSVLGGIGTALLGNTIFYLRKLYKACIRAEIHVPSNEEGKIQAIGVFSYYFFRPFFACAFALFIIICVNSGISNVVVNEPKFGNGFINLIMFLSFFGGFAAGDFLTLLELKSEDVLGTIIDKKEND